MDLTFIATLIIACNLAPSLSTNLTIPKSMAKVKAVDQFNASAPATASQVKDNSTEAILDFVCHPKRPLIEPLIAAGLVDNSSRLPAKIQEKLANSGSGISDGQKPAKVHLVCKGITSKGMDGDEYLCKRKPLDASSSEDDDILVDYGIGVDEDYS